MNRNTNLENGDDPRDHRNEQEIEYEKNWQPVTNEKTFNGSPVPVFVGGIKKDKPISVDTEFYCKKCNCRVWISNESKEVIRNRFLCINFNKKYGLCRYCFVSVKDLNVLFEGAVDDGK
jgi:hypothetical protein